MKLFKKLGLFLFGIAGVLGLASCGAKQMSVDYSTSKMNLSSTVQARTTVTDEDIANYIKGKTNPGASNSVNTLYYVYDVIVNRTGTWELTEDADIYGEDDEAGEIHVSDYNIPLTISMKKGKAYLFDMLYYTNWQGKGYSCQEFLRYATKMTDGYPAIRELYGIDNNDLRNEIAYVLGSDFNIKYEYDSGYEFPEDAYDICQEIDTRFKAKLDQIYSNEPCDFKIGGSNFLFVPAIDYTLTVDKSEISNYPGARFQIREADITPLAVEIPDTSDLSIEGIDNSWLEMLKPSGLPKYRYLHTSPFNGSELNRLLKNDVKNRFLPDTGSHRISAESVIILENQDFEQAIFKLYIHIFYRNNYIESYSLDLDYIADNPTFLELNSYPSGGYVDELKITDFGYSEDLISCANEQFGSDFGTISANFFDSARVIEYVKVDNTISYNPNIAYDQSIDYLFLKLLSCTCVMSDSTKLPYLDTTAPSIEGENIYINVDNPLSFEQIKSHFSAHDETDGDITDRLSFTDNTYILTNGKIACGTYSFKVSVSDKAGNTTTKLYYAHVVDYTDPTIKGSTINVSYTKKLTSSEIKNLFTYGDNYTPANQLLFRIVEDNYSATYQNLGAHTITAKIIDQQGNEATAISTVNVIDDKAPFMVLPENLKITTLDNWTLENFRPYITVTDEKEGNITNFELTDLDGYLNDTKKAGTFRIKVVASDSAGNSIENTFSFLNEDKDMPSIKIDPDFIMVVNKGDSITKEQVINYFIRTGQLTLEEAETIEVTSLYFDAPIQAGYYSLRLSNDYKVIESKIRVLDDGTTSEDPITPTDPINPNGKNKFFTAEGYKENFFKPGSWNVCHYATIVGVVIVLFVAIYIVVKKKH